MRQVTRSWLLENEPELADRLEGCWDYAFNEWLPAIGDNKGSFNSFPHLRNLEMYLDEILFAKHPRSGRPVIEELALTSSEVYTMLCSILFHDLGRSYKGGFSHACRSRIKLAESYRDLGLRSEELALCIGRISHFHDPDEKADGKAVIKRRSDGGTEQSLPIELRDVTITGHGLIREKLLGALLVVIDHLDGTFSRVLPHYVRLDEFGTIGKFRSQTPGIHVNLAARMVVTTVKKPMPRASSDKDPFPYGLFRLDLNRQAPEIISISKLLGSPSFLNEYPAQPEHIWDARRTELTRQRSLALAGPTAGDLKAVAEVVFGVNCSRGLIDPELLLELQTVCLLPACLGESVKKAELCLELCQLLQIDGPYSSVAANLSSGRAGKLRSAVEYPREEALEDLRKQSRWFHVRPLLARLSYSRSLCIDELSAKWGQRTSQALPPCLRRRVQTETQIISDQTDEILARLDIGKSIDQSRVDRLQKPLARLRKLSELEHYHWCFRTEQGAGLPKQLESIKKRLRRINGNLKKARGREKDPHRRKVLTTKITAVGEIVDVFGRPRRGSPTHLLPLSKRLAGDPCSKWRAELMVVEESLSKSQKGLLRQCYDALREFDQLSEVLFVKCPTEQQKAARNLCAKPAGFHIADEPSRLSLRQEPFTAGGAKGMDPNVSGRFCQRVLYLHDQQTTRLTGEADKPEPGGVFQLVPLRSEHPGWGVGSTLVARQLAFWDSEGAPEAQRNQLLLATIAGDTLANARALRKVSDLLQTYGVPLYAWLLECDAHLYTCFGSETFEPQLSKGFLRRLAEAMWDMSTQIFGRRIRTYESLAAHLREDSLERVRMGVRRLAIVARDPAKGGENSGTEFLEDGWYWDRAGPPLTDVLEWIKGLVKPDAHLKTVFEDWPKGEA